MQSRKTTNSILHRNIHNVYEPQKLHARTLTKWSKRGTEGLNRNAFVCDENEQCDWRGQPAQILSVWKKIKAHQLGVISASSRCLEGCAGHSARLVIMDYSIVNWASVIIVPSCSWSAGADARATVLNDFLCSQPVISNFFVLDYQPVWSAISHAAAFVGVAELHWITSQTGSCGEGCADFRHADTGLLNHNRSCRLILGGQQFMGTCCTHACSRNTFVCCTSILIIYTELELDRRRTDSFESNSFRRTDSRVRHPHHGR
jgi:hypothetical protein